VGGGGGGGERLILIKGKKRAWKFDEPPEEPPLVRPWLKGFQR